MFIPSTAFPADLDTVPLPSDALSTATAGASIRFFTSPPLNSYISIFDAVIKSFSFCVESTFRRMCVAFTVTGKSTSCAFFSGLNSPSHTTAKSSSCGVCVGVDIFAARI